ncbi:methyltransferase domain-containing protein [Candidatus Bathyarchaeota archaeon]|nr:MAG: methyltransferase domain-containing protein [Candidatus Bathyarchaeota archaeon]
MDRWKYYDIIHQRHSVMNPVNETKLERLYDLLELKPNARAIDIGCGKGEMLMRLAEKYDIKGLGIDKSPYCILEAQKLKRQRIPQANLKFLEMDGAQYKPETGEYSDLTMCIGATWIYGGYKNTVSALCGMTRAPGFVMVGEPLWRTNPPKEYLQSEGLSADSFDTHQGNVRTGESEGLRPVFTLVGSKEDWDRSEGLHWTSATEYAFAHPEDTDLEELLARDSKERESYLRWGRDTLGWAIYLFRKM